MVFVDFKRLKSPTTWHRTIQFRLALSPQNSLGFQSLPDITMDIKSKPVSSIKFCWRDGSLQGSCFELIIECLF